jgi:hypothetical protein
LAQLNLDQKLENSKIDLISSDFFNLPESFDLLSGSTSEINSKSLQSVVCDLSEQDCETFLYCFQQPMTYQVYREQVIQPLSDDFQEILEMKSKQTLKEERTDDMPLEEKQLLDGHQEYVAEMKNQTIAGAMKSIIVNNMHCLEERRQYLKDVRYTQLSTNTKKGCHLDLNDLIHFKPDFV